MSRALLKITDLNVRFDAASGPVDAVRGLSLTVQPGEKLGLVGESGSGKTTTGLATLALLPRQARITAGHIFFAGKDITHPPHALLRHLRGKGVAMVFQNPRAALSPVQTIGAQITNVIRAHEHLSRRSARDRALALLDAVQLDDPARQFDAYAHELSGGMCQRAMIAMAIACSPRLLIADELTTGLDATIQLAVMQLLERLVAERGMALLFISHDLGLAGTYCDRIAVMREGTAVETAPTRTLFAAPRDRYTKRLIGATPSRDTVIEDLVAATGANLPPRRRREQGGGLLEVRGLCKRFGAVAAVTDLSFQLAPGESLGLVGESGAGKTTIARMLCKLLDPSGGEIVFDGREIGAIPARRFHVSPLRQQIQLVFQDAAGSLFPRFTAFDAIADALRRIERVRGPALGRRVTEAAEAAGLDTVLLDRRPHQLSGGEKARVVIARALAVKPVLLVLDEPTASLDVLVQAQILILLERLKRERGMSYVFVSHDLNVVRMMCDRTMVLRAGRVVEVADSDALFTAPQQEYTRALLDASPSLPSAVAR